MKTALTDIVLVRHLENKNQNSYVAYAYQMLQSPVMSELRYDFLGDIPYSAHDLKAIKKNFSRYQLSLKIYQSYRCIFDSRRHIATGGRIMQIQAIMHQQVHH